MSLTLEPEALVIYIDTRVNQILSNNEDPIELFIFLGEIAGELSKFIRYATKNEMATYQEQYQGFHAFMTFWKDLSSIISRDTSSTPTYH